MLLGFRLKANLNFFLDDFVRREGNRPLFADEGNLHRLFDRLPSIEVY